MKTTTTPRDCNPMGLAEYLRTIRQSKNLSLREVEEATERAVSNPYLSQLENGKIHKPSPNILHALAQVYGVEYEMLMEKAGYLASVRVGDKSQNSRHGRLATLSTLNLTTEEEEELLRYLGYLRDKQGRHKDASK